MREQLKQRLVGAAVLVALGVIVIPEFLEPPEDPVTPFEPKARTEGGDFAPEVVVLEGQPLSGERDASSRVPAPVAPPSPAAPLVESPEERARPTQSHTSAAVDAEPSAPRSQPGVVASTQQSVVPTKTWVLQLATFSRERNARDLQSKLREMGYPAFLENRSGQKGTLTLVFVGPIEAKDEAQKALARLEKEFKLKGLVLQR